MLQQDFRKRYTDLQESMLLLCLSMCEVIAWISTKEKGYNSDTKSLTENPD
jgi:hypothetical protein